MNLSFLTENVAWPSRDQLFHFVSFRSGSFHFVPDRSGPFQPSITVTVTMFIIFHSLYTYSYIFDENFFLINQWKENFTKIPRASPRECSSRMFLLSKLQKKKFVKNETKITSNNCNSTQTRSFKNLKKQQVYANNLIEKNNHLKA